MSSQALLYISFPLTNGGRLRRLTNGVIKSHAPCHVEGFKACKTVDSNAKMLNNVTSTLVFSLHPFPPYSLRTNVSSTNQIHRIIRLDDLLVDMVGSVILERKWAWFLGRASDDQICSGPYFCA